jgi:hypothetical protein
MNLAAAWSDDRLKANFHRVRAKGVGKSPGQYLIAYFNTGRRISLFKDRKISSKSHFCIKIRRI